MAYKILLKQQESDELPLWTTHRVSETIGGVVTWSDWECDTEGELETKLEELQSEYLPSELKAIEEVDLTFSVDAIIV